jgi:hypothetical protein
MKSIVFNAAYGDVIKIVEISKPSGMGGSSSLHFYVNRFYNGDLKKRDGNWILESPKPNDLTSDDLQILGRMIEEADDSTDP